MSVTVSEFTRDPGAYLALSATEDVYITRNGLVIARLTSPNQDRVAAVKSLLGVLPADMTEEQAREERLNTI